MRRLGHWIAGEERPAASGASFDDRAPATGKVIARVARGGPAEVAEAVRAGREALAGEWGGLGARARADIACLARRSSSAKSVGTRGFRRCTPAV